MGARRVDVGPDNGNGVDCGVVEGGVELLGRWVSGRNQATEDGVERLVQAGRAMVNCVPLSSKPGVRLRLWPFRC